MRGTQWIGVVLGVLVLIIFLLLPPFEPITRLGMKAVGVLLFTILWWVFVDTGFSSLLAIALLALTEVMTPKEVFAASLGSWLAIFLIGCFGLTQAIRLSGFSQRFAYWFLTRPFARGHPWLLLALFFFGVTVMGAIMSSAVTAILFMSLAVPLLTGMGYKKGDRFAAMVIMGIAWAATASFIMTPIGHAGNMIAIDWIRRDTGYAISFPAWMVVGIPMGLLFFFLLLGVFRYIVHPDVNKFRSMADDYVHGEAGKIGPVKLEEKVALGVFAGVVLFWILPGMLGSILPEVSTYLNKLGYAIPPLVGATLLCMMRVKNQPLLTFHQWMGGVEWGTIALVAAIMAIGEVLGNPQTGISQLLTSAIQPLVANAPFFMVVLVSVLWVVLQTNIMSNLVTAILVYTIMIPAVIAGGVGNPVALGFTIFGSSHYAFSLPSATAVTAIVVGSGWVSVAFLGRYGVMLLIPVILIFTFIGYPLAAFIFR